jgi:Xaa-Pro aminopeptidase
MATEILPDDRALRFGRRQRAMAEMAAHDLDVVVLGRAANVRYMTGAPPLWTAGTRAFGPSCVVIRSTGAIHMLSTWDEGVPEEIPHENLYGITWNPMNLVTVLKGIDGAAGPRRVGTDALTPRFAQLLPMAFPSAELVDCEPAMQAARRIKTTEEVAAIRAATGVAEDALAAAVGELRAGVTERELTGIFMDAMASRGVTTPARQDVARITSRHGQRGRVGDERTRAGDLVAVTPPRSDGRGPYQRTAASVTPTSTGDGMRCGHVCSPHASPVRQEPPSSPPTKRPGSRRRRCRAPAGSAWASTLRW